MKRWLTLAMVLGGMHGASAETLHLIVGHSICGLPGEGQIATSSPIDLDRGMTFEMGSTVPVRFDQFKESRPILKGFLDQAIAGLRDQRTYAIAACVPGYQFAPMSAYPGQGVGTWAPEGPNLPPVLRHLHAVISANPQIRSLAVYFLNGFNDALFAAAAGQTELLYLEGAFVAIHRAIAETAQRAGIRTRVPLVIEKPMTVYAPGVQEWVYKMNAVADRLVRGRGAIALPIGPVTLIDAIHPNIPGIQTIGAAFGKQAVSLSRSNARE